jgi:hypothetical protein
MGGGLGSLGELDGEAIAPCQSAQKKKKGRLPALGKINMRSQLENVLVQTRNPSRLVHPQPNSSAPSDPSARVISRHLFHPPFCSNIPTMDPDMDFDDDAPPMLVAADQSDDTDNLSADVDDINLKRVPITIITGR